MVSMAMASLLVERDVLALLKGDATLTAIVPAAHVYPTGETSEPAWPFIIPVEPQGLPLKADCVRGATINIGLSAFTRGRAATTARDESAQIGDAIEKRISGQRDLPGIGTVRYTVADTVLRQDVSEPGARQFSCTVRARVLAEA